jgi:hypothetical protein
VSPFVLPEAPHLRAYFEMLFGEGVHVRAGERESPDASWYGVFRDDAGTAVAVCLCDIDFGAYAGAALSMLMPNDARAAVRNGAISEVMRANLHEIMNILSSLLMNDHTPHLRLREMSTPDDVDATVRDIVSAPSRRIAFRIDIPRYGRGRLALVLK